MQLYDICNKVTSRIILNCILQYGSLLNPSTGPSKQLMPRKRILPACSAILELLGLEPPANDDNPQNVPFVSHYINQNFHVGIILGE